eukprot:scaffold6509_cov121-Isochrysis_galbana.AAC.2
MLPRAPEADQFRREGWEVCVRCLEQRQSWGPNTSGKKAQRLVAWTNGHKAHNTQSYADARRRWSEAADLGGSPRGGA